MSAPDHKWAYQAEVPDFGFGRKAIKRDRSPNFCLWLQAADRRIVIYVRLTSSSGNSDAEFPLLEALRTKPGVPRPAAFDPKQTKRSGLDAPLSGHMRQRSWSEKLPDLAKFRHLRCEPGGLSLT